MSTPEKTLPFMADAAQSRSARFFSSSPSGIRTLPHVCTPTSIGFVSFFSESTNAVSSLFSKVKSTTLRVHRSGRWLYV